MLKKTIKILYLKNLQEKSCGIKNFSNFALHFSDISKYKKMYAIVEIAGQQFKVEKDQEIFVHRLEGDVDSKVEFDNVLLYDNDGKVSVGTPNVEGVKITGKIVEHLKGDKVTVFHKKRRKGYQKENGHRQYLSKILIEGIVTGAKKTKKAAEKKEEAPKADAKKETPKAEKEEVKAPKETKPKAEKKAAKPKAEKKEAKPKAEKKDKDNKKEDKQ